MIELLVVEAVLLEHLGHRLRVENPEAIVFFWSNQHVVDLDYAFFNILRPCRIELLLELKLEKGHSVDCDSELMCGSVVA